MPEGLTRGRLGPRTTHLCVDMQNMFARDTDWRTPWAVRVLPSIVRLVGAHPAATIFTRFIPARRPGEGVGTWRRYYERWASMTLESLAPGMVELVPELAGFVPPATVIDKPVYSPWLDSGLADALAGRGADTLVVTGGETDVCVLASVLGAVDRGFRVVVVRDCLCNSSDEAHDASLTVYRERYGQQVEVAACGEVMDAWG